MSTSSTQPSQQQNQSKQLVKFSPFRSIANPTFWLSHNSHKLNELRLSEDGVPLHGYFAPTASNNISGTPGMRFDYSISSSSRTSENLSGISEANNTEEVIRRNEYIKSTGKIYSLNTLESFKTINKNTFLNESCLPSLLSCCGVKATTEQLLEDGGSSSSNSREEEEEDDDDKPNKSLVSTACITYCNLKTNLIVYWFGYPALVPRTGCGIAYCASSNSNCCQQQKLVNAWGSGACRILSNSFHKFRIQQEKNANETNGDGGHHDLVWCPPFFMILPDSNSSEMKNIKCLPLNKCTYTALSEEDRERVIFAFVDPNTTAAAASTTTADEPDAVGWTLRNLVAYLSLRFRLGGCHRIFLSYRSPLLRRVTLSDEVKIDSNGVEEEEYVNMKMRESFEDIGGEEQDDTAGIGGSLLLLDIAVPLASDYQWPTATSSEATASSIDYNLSLYRCVGWELNKNNKPGPRSIDLRPLVSPAHLSRQANDLNLRLMKWRALPSLDVEKLSKLKVLLLGAGTLGCGVARTLLGWGIRKITFVDSGRVSYSNPVRQSLFGVDDCKDGGKYKAVAAAESLVAIAGTDVKSAGVVLTIPMPGHSFGKGKDGSGETEAVRKDVERLHSLIDESDVVFLLTDTRESRWLPTVIALATETPLINSALGLDSWLVMRHGPSSSCLSSSPVVCSTNNQQQQRLGCYFCSDVVAPENSTRDRTLDQQCTVTRPGLAPIAASMATELFVAMFHHEFGHCAPAPEQKRDNSSSSGAYAPVDDGTDASSSALGRLPHQIRGTVVTYTMMTPTIPAFPSCTACSDNVVKEYQKQRFDFVKCVCCDEDGSYLEKVSGLATFREEADKKLDECFDWDDEIDDDEDE